MQVFGFISSSLPPLTKAAKFILIWRAANCRYASSKCTRKLRRGCKIKEAYFTSGRTHVMHTTVTTQQFQTSAVSFGFFLDASFTAEKTTEQTRGGEKLRVETWL